ncbi:MAG: DUF1553 domain-containing protein [Opitutus sp.]|nr:DUF1553 domain-containing protein [Opitutus sp.]
MKRHAVLLSALAFGATLGAQEKLPLGHGAGGVLTLLETHCVSCHGGEKTKAGLDLVTRDTLLRGGESGAAIVPGQPQASLLYKMVAHLEEPGMPHKEAKLPDAAIHQIADWIAAGAPYARPLDKTPGAPAAAKKVFAITADDRAHWSFQPVRRPEPPAVKNAAAVRTPIDRFILAELEAKALAPAAAAEKETLIRRVTLDLIGLPPTPGDIDAFVRDAAPDAYERLVERLLASPHYGERWGRHWLDLARFAESDGFESDTVRPHAWRYRDYVVGAFNADKPYDRFVREQIAGDELFPAEPDALIATAFNLLGPDMVDSADQVQRRRNTLNDMTDTASLAFLGLTLGCARCHDHKFEPIAQRDYYSLQAFFTSVKFRTDLPVPTAAERAEHEAATARYKELTASIQSEIDVIEGPARQRIYARKLATLSPEGRGAHAIPAEQRTTEQQNLFLETVHLVEITPKELAAALKKPEKEALAKLHERLRPFPKPPLLPATLSLQNGPPLKTHVLHRGDYNQPGAEVAPAFPDVLAAPPPVSTKRAGLAEWVASRTNPLTARVMVNRVWRHHFGRALVATPSDFGTHGQKPSHPALLDWLASEFVARGWSVKHLHRVMLLSATYRQSTAATPATRARDPENKLYSRMNRLRLEGEVIRDSLLAISGQLNPQVGGPGVFPPIPRELYAGAKGWTVSADPRDHARRSLYIFARRNLRFPFLEVFDAPDNNLSCSARERSTTAPQSLTLLNADEVLAAATRTAERVEREAESPEARLTLAYRLIIGRGPTGQERRLSQDFLAHSPLAELCRGLFNLNAFVYVD